MRAGNGPIRGDIYSLRRSCQAGALSRSDVRVFASSPGVGERAEQADGPARRAAPPSNRCEGEQRESNWPDHAAQRDRDTSEDEPEHPSQ